MLLLEAESEFSNCRSDLVEQENIKFIFYFSFFEKFKHNFKLFPRKQKNFYLNWKEEIFLFAELWMFEGW